MGLNRVVAWSTNGRCCAAASASAPQRFGLLVWHAVVDRRCGSSDHRCAGDRAHRSGPSHPPGHVSSSACSGPRWPAARSLGGSALGESTRPWTPAPPPNRAADELSQTMTSADDEGSSPRRCHRDLGRSTGRTGRPRPARRRRRRRRHRPRRSRWSVASFSTKATSMTRPSRRSCRSARWE